MPPMAVTGHENTSSTAKRKSKTKDNFVELFIALRWIDDSGATSTEEFNSEKYQGAEQSAGLLLHGTVGERLKKCAKRCNYSEIEKLIKQSPENVTSDKKKKRKYW